jgi:hypothetical protein
MPLRAAGPWQASTGLIARACSALVLAYAAATVYTPLVAHAAPEEIVVFADEFEKKGEWGYELHLNYVPSGRRTPDYDGEQPPQGIFRFMPEAVYGLSDKWNIGLHVPMSKNFHTGSTTVDGFKVRLQYLTADETAKGSLFYGVNTEINYLARRLSESRVVLELRGIVGWRSGDWLFAVNPILNRPLNYVPGVDNHVNFDLFAKALKHIRQGLGVGLEHYAELGEVQHLTFGSRSGQITYAVAEFETKSHFDIQVGIGRGWTDPVDKWVYKVMLGLPF